MSSILRWYNQLLLRRPLLTNMISTGFLFGSGDFLAQRLFPPQDGEIPPYDYLRTLRAVTYGSIVFAPIGDRWYKLLNRIKMPVRIRKAKVNNMGDTLLRVGADQLIFAPFIGIPLYYSVMTVFEGHPEIIQTIRYKLDTNWWNTLWSNWLVWPLFQLFNFYLLPTHFRLLAVNVFSIGWNCYLSYLLNWRDVKIGSNE
ncbi:predicted protein [Scheffersomyces stipitis CBS 6054]|uniref:Protein SYM1 n=1 Tax=Scheffersomyces stipitis (strain ATCC 58785 / CBS 6054 / NBRC 10063 / NRRL Y-11545) TaxID=322104 RepID=A3LW00_PICST|nr:predicted protein [Scheffersomyces stipitis CBS 6054]ABN66872.2 predicted protein [Scheffersomyces stipitis CBS 6054]KAG2734826.1 hypothetical protein G9P44_002832 [Scheffersomyces stipitis]